MITIKVDSLKHLIETDPSTVVIDVRSPSEFAEVRVAVARNEPLGDFSPAKLIAEGGLPATGPVYLLCRSGKRAEAAAERFVDGGRGVVVEGGTQAWIAAGYPVVRGRKSSIDIERQVRIFAGSLVFAGTLLGLYVYRGFFAIPAFVGAGLVFAGITGFCGAGLLLAKLPFNRK